MITSGIYRVAVQSFFACAVLAGLIGCNEASKATSSDMMRYYEARQYRQARAAARDVADGSVGRQRDEARYIAGLSAYRLGKSNEALVDLEPLVRHADDELAGNAAATAGLIHIDAGRDDEALRVLRIASEKLSGNDRGRVYHYIGQIHQRAGRWAEARTAMSLALSYARDPNLRQAIREQMNVSAFTLQFGAYQNASTANTRLRQVAPLVTARRIGAAVIAPSITTEGKRLYLVQAGRFVTHDQASAARSRLRINDAIIVPAFD
jgi:tetratricopeptide (TPR) repeat protein